MGSDPVYTLDFWMPLIAERIALFHPDNAKRPGVYAFSRAWVDFESEGGNPCAFGDPPPVGTAPDGQPREIGIAQYYNPDDFKVFAPVAAQLGVTITSKTMRAYCRPGTQHRTRMLTADELIEQIEALLIKVDEGIKLADEKIAKHELTWNEIDVWKLCKAKHAYPPILAGLDVLAGRGQKPDSWATYRSQLNTVPYYAPDARDPDLVSPKNPQGYVHLAMHRGFEMCNKIGEAVAASGELVA